MIHSQETDFRPANPLVTTSGSSHWTALVNENKFVRECIHRAFAFTGNRVISYSSVDEYERSDDAHAGHGVVVLCIGHRNVADPSVARDLAHLAAAPGAQPVVVLGEIETYEQITGALEAGAKGYIPASTPLDVMVEALALVRVGGVFLPTAILTAAANGGRGAAREDAKTMFTSRQAAVVKALRQGKANKLIAYELNMCESTVKVHVRNIMRKLNAHNRTEVAYRTNGMFPEREAS